MKQLSNIIFKNGATTKIILMVFIPLLVSCKEHQSNSDKMSRQSSKERLIVLADMGHDPDEEQQIVHLLTRSNEVEIEGLIAVTGRFFRPDPPDTVKDLRPFLFHNIIDGYAGAYPNLLLHAEEWPDPGYLHSIVSTGQTGNGMKDVWPGNSSPGSQMIIKAATKEDIRPQNIVINAGANTLAQALVDYREKHTGEEMQDFIARLRIYENSGQDDAGAWICREFPEIFWIRSIAQNRCFGGPSNDNLGPHCWKPFDYSPEGQHDWVDTHIREGHGTLGAAYPHRKVGPTTHYLEGGGTIPLLGYSIRGLTDMAEPSWGGWGGRFSAEKLPNVSSAFRIIHPDEKLFEPYMMYSENPENPDHWTNHDDGAKYHNLYASIWRWRQAMWNDLRARMDWCVDSYEKANHHPVAILNDDNSNRILKMETKPGKMVRMDASASKDPDGDSLSYHWWFYSEAGEDPYLADIPIKHISDAKIEFQIPPDAIGKELHLILEVSDNHPEVNLVDYRRTVVFVK